MGGTASTAKLAPVAATQQETNPPVAPQEGGEIPEGTTPVTPVNELPKTESKKRSAPDSDGNPEYDPSSIFGRIHTWFKAQSANMEKVPGLADLDGEVAIKLLVETFYNKIMEDDNLAKYFEGVSMELLRRHQVLLSLLSLSYYYFY